MPREYSDSYNSEEDSSTNSWRSISQGDFEANLTRFRSSARGMGRRSDETLNKPWTPKASKKDKKKKKKSKKRQRNSTSSASSNGSGSSSPRNARTQSATADRGRKQSKSKSNFREESKHDFESRKERLKRKEEEAIRREFKKRKGYGISSDSESSSGSDSDNQYTSTNSNSYTSESESESEQPDDSQPTRLQRFDTHDHRAIAKSRGLDSTPDKRRAPSESSEYSSEERNPFMRLSQLQRQRDEQDPTRSGYRKSDEFYAKAERQDADDFLANRRRLGDAEYYRQQPHDDPRNYTIRTEDPANNVCSCVIS